MNECFVEMIPRLADYYHKLHFPSLYCPQSCYWRPVNVEENYEWMSSELFEAICDIWHDEHQDSERERALYR